MTRYFLASMTQRNPPFYVKTRILETFRVHGETWALHFGYRDGGLYKISHLKTGTSCWNTRFEDKGAAIKIITHQLSKQSKKFIQKRIRITENYIADSKILHGKFPIKRFFN